MGALSARHMQRHLCARWKVAGVSIQLVGPGRPMHANPGAFFKPVFQRFGMRLAVRPFMLSWIRFFLSKCFCYFLKLMLQKSTEI